MPDSLDLDCDFADRFVYWQGASGRRYIHTVYAADACPPLPGAIYVSVGREPDGRRRALAVGCFARLFALNLARSAGAGGIVRQVDEVHVHLLAADESERQAILADLSAGLGVVPQPTPAPALVSSASTLQLSLSAA
jgi:hypothetical protein